MICKYNKFFETGVCIVMILRYILVSITSFFLWLLQSCNTNQSVSVPTFQDTLLQYLKNDLGIVIDTADLDTDYRTGLQQQTTSLAIDSLLLNNTEVINYPSNNIRLLVFTNRLRYKPKSGERKNGYAIHFIQDIKTGKFYVDWINDELFFIVESFCGYSSVNFLNKSNKGSVQLTDIHNFNAIPSDRFFGDHELQVFPQKRGLEQLLNVRYRFDKINDAGLDSLFKCYDQVYSFPSATAKNASELLALMSEVKNKITSQYNSRGRKQRLLYLKDQFSLLLLKQQQSGNDEYHNRKYYLRIFKRNDFLFVREVTITGVKASGYSHYINEYSFCF